MIGKLDDVVGIPHQLTFNGDRMATLLDFMVVSPQEIEEIENRLDEAIEEMGLAEYREQKRLEKEKEEGVFRLDMIKNPFDFMEELNEHPELSELFTKCVDEVFSHTHRYQFPIEWAWDEKNLTRIRRSRKMLPFIEAIKDLGEVVVAYGTFEGCLKCLECIDFEEYKMDKYYLDECFNWIVHVKAVKVTVCGEERWELSIPYMPIHPSLDPYEYPWANEYEDQTVELLVEEVGK